MLFTIFKALTGLERVIPDLLHLGFQLYNSFASRHEAATGGLIPYPIQEEPLVSTLVGTMYGLPLEQLLSIAREI